MATMALSCHYGYSASSDCCCTRFHGSLAKGTDPWKQLQDSRFTSSKFDIRVKWPSALVSRPPRMVPTADHRRGFASSGRRAPVRQEGFEMRESSHFRGSSFRGTCECFDLFDELVPYVEAWNWQKETVSRMCADVTAGEEPPHALILLQHPPVYTMGTRSSDKYLQFNVENPPFELHRTERGGEVTYHGPGQLVMYPILNLRHHKTDLHWYLRMLEEVVIRTLRSACGLEASRIDGLTGVWVGEVKVAAIGVRVSRWITYHGLALNVSTDLSPFRNIVPCGIADRPVGNIQDLLMIAARDVDNSESHDATVRRLWNESRKRGWQRTLLSMASTYYDLCTIPCSRSLLKFSACSLFLQVGMVLNVFSKLKPSLLDELYDMFRSISTVNPRLIVKMHSFSMRKGIVTTGRQAAMPTADKSANISVFRKPEMCTWNSGRRMHELGDVPSPMQEH